MAIMKLITQSTKMLVNVLWLPPDFHRGRAILFDSKDLGASLDNVTQTVVIFKGGTT